MAKREHIHKFKFTPVPGGMRRRCILCGYSVVEYSQGVMTDRVTKGLYDGGKRAGRPPKKKKKRKRNPSGR